MKKQNLNKLMNQKSITDFLNDYYVTNNDINIFDYSNLPTEDLDNNDYNQQTKYATAFFTSGYRRDFFRIDQVIDLEQLFSFLKKNEFKFDNIFCENISATKIIEYQTYNSNMFNFIARNKDSIIFGNIEVYTSHFSIYTEKNIFKDTEELIEEFEKALESGVKIVRTKKQVARVSVVVNQPGGFRLVQIGDSDPTTKANNSFSKTLLETNYPSVNHKKINEFIGTSGKDLAQKGKLLLMCGEPGTGKTTYIRNLINNQIDPETNIVLLNPTNIKSFSDPNFLTFAFTSLSNSILLIEEAEKVIVSREETKNTDKDNSSISDLLNITDGILGDALNIKVIATFNTSSVNVDRALKRDGRLFHMQDFDLLSYQEIQNFFRENKCVVIPYRLDQLLKQQQEKEGSNIVIEDNVCKASLADCYAILRDIQSNQSK